MKFLKLIVYFLLPAISFTAPVRAAHALVNDRTITIKTSADVAAKRKALIRYLWGTSGFPKDKLPSSVQRNVKSPVNNIGNLERVDTLHISMDNGISGLSHHFIPKRKNNRLVVLHLGHTDNCTFNDGINGEPDIGMRRTMNRLLAEGFSVLAVYMPHISIEDCTWGHGRMLALVTTGSPMKFFLEPAVVSLNYLKASNPGYKNISMIGLSGGGWTTTVSAAIDPRIQLSIPVAGSLPLYLCHDPSIFEPEELLDSFYRIAGYPELYVLGGSGKGRKQIQVLNRKDDCCFGERQHNAAKEGKSFTAAVREFESAVKQALTKLGTGSFRVVIDEVAPGHMISNYAIDKVIIPALLQGH